MKNFRLGSLVVLLCTALGCGAPSETDAGTGGGSSGSAGGTATGGGVASAGGGSATGGGDVGGGTASSGGGSVAGGGTASTGGGDGTTGGGTATTGGGSATTGGGTATTGGGTASTGGGDGTTGGGSATTGGGTATTGGGDGTTGGGTASTGGGTATTGGGTAMTGGGAATTGGGTATTGGGAATTGGGTATTGGGTATTGGGTATTGGGTATTGGGTATTGGGTAIGGGTGVDAGPPPDAGLARFAFFDGTQLGNYTLTFVSDAGAPIVMGLPGTAAYLPDPPVSGSAGSYRSSLKSIVPGTYTATLTRLNATVLASQSVTFADQGYSGLSITGSSIHPFSIADSGIAGARRVVLVHNIVDLNAQTLSVDFATDGGFLGPVSGSAVAAPIAFGESATFDVPVGVSQLRIKPSIDDWFAIPFVTTNSELQDGAQVAIVLQGNLNSVTPGLRARSVVFSHLGDPSTAVSRIDLPNAKFQIVNLIVPHSADAGVSPSVQVGSGAKTTIGAGLALGGVSPSFTVNPGQTVNYALDQAVPAWGSMSHFVSNMPAGSRGLIAMSVGYGHFVSDPRTTLDDKFNVVHSHSGVNGAQLYAGSSSGNLFSTINEPTIALSQNPGLGPAWTNGTSTPNLTIRVGNTAQSIIYRTAGVNWATKWGMVFFARSSNLSGGLSDIRYIYVNAPSSKAYAPFTAISAKTPCQGIMCTPLP